ncbi:LPS O-antigen length regulator Wzz(fepE) [Morganella morganii]|uniref:LPS O-antigen length regulator Wzz(fepE) n=1 Tax=Morganella morganii TaxID=582 RepID=UPI001A33BD7B|nr:LPS O-antigen length regulator [Vibrio vulnificus]
MISNPSKEKPSEIDKGNPCDFHLIQNNEINFLWLFTILYKSKFVIIGVTLLFTIAGFAVISFMPSKWTSQAVITEPTAYEIKQLKTNLNTLMLVDINTNINELYIYNKFINNYNSRVLQEEYLVGTDYYKKLLTKIQNPTPISERKLIEKIITKDINLDTLDRKSNDERFNNEINLSFTAPTSEEAYNLLSGYISFISTKVRTEVKDELDDQVKLKLIYEQKALQMDLERAANERSVNVQRIKYAIDIATAAGIKKPISSVSAQIKDDPDYSISIGSDALSKKLAITQTITDPTMISTELKNRLYNIQQLESIKLNDLAFVPFKYLLKPYEPTNKDAPKRVLILTSATFVGFILSIIGVLLRHMIKITVTKIKNIYI